MTGFCQNIMRKLFFLFISLGVVLSISSCNKRRYPCPGNGTAEARDLSLFDEEGNLKSTKKKSQKKTDRGLVTKKQDDRLKNRRKKSLDDKPKNMKK